MEELIELVAILKKTKFKSLGLRHLALEAGSQLEKFYEGIAEGHLLTDEDAVRYLSDLDFNPEWVPQLKSKLKNRLLDMLLLLDLKSSVYDDRGTSYAECTRQWAIINILLYKKARINALALLQDLLRNTQRFEFTEITIEALRTLALHQGLVEGNQQRLAEVEALLEHTEALRAAEFRAQRLYLYLVNGAVRQKAAKHQLADKAKTYAEQVAILMREFKSYEVHLYGRLIELVYFDTINDQTTVADLAQSAIQFFETKPYQSRMAMQAFYYYWMTAQLHLQQYELLRATVKKCAVFFEEGTHNWFKLKELEFLSGMHATDYAMANAVYREVTTREAYPNQASPVWELWKIFGAWLAFLDLTGSLPKHEGSAEVKFKVHKFANEVPIYSRDKSGMNVSILVVQFLHHLAAHDYGACIDRVEALSKYRQRYLKTKENIRSQYFVRLLELIPRNHFIRHQVERSCALLIEQLRATPLEDTNQNYEIEVLPYEIVWNLVIAHLPAQLGDGEQLKVA